MKLTLAIPNGSLFEATKDLLFKAGINISVNGRTFLADITGSQIFSQAIIMRPQDMPEAMIDGMIDVAILGYDCLAESGLNDQLTVIKELNYGKNLRQSVRLVVFGQTEKMIDEQKTLVTSEYPNLTREIFRNAKIRFSHGGTEQKVAYGKYDYGVCIVESGMSLKANDLKIVKTILTSPTVLVAREESSELNCFGDLMEGVLLAENYHLLKMNAKKEDLEKIIKILPALGSPTISQRSNGDIAIESVVPKDNVGNLIISLKILNAIDIVVQKVDICCK